MFPVASLNGTRRQEIEDAQFVYATFMLDLLLQQYDRRREAQDATEVQHFVAFLIKHKEWYLNAHWRDELKCLQRNCTNYEYLRRLAMTYKYWTISASQKVYEKIECITQEMCRYLTTVRYS